MPTPFSETDKRSLIPDWLSGYENIPQRYIPQRVLGAGGMGVVLLVKDQLARWNEPTDVAMKILKRLPAGPLTPHRDSSAPSPNEDSWATISDEFLLLSRLRHPNLSQVFDFGQLPGSQHPYFTMEYVQGRPMDEAIPNLSLQDSITVFIEFLRGLQYIHDRGYLHLDIKPANVLVEDKTQRTILLDFGLSRRRTFGDLPKRLFGTPVTMAPEVWQRQRLDHRTDLYAVGATLFRALTGRFPFSGDLQATLQGHLHSPVPSLASQKPPLPATLQTVVRQLLAKQPKDRYQSAAEAVSALATIAAPTRGRLESRDTLHGYIVSGSLLERQQEQLRLLELVQQTTADSRGRVLCVLSEAGLGKSRLLRDVGIELQTRQGAQLHRGSFREKGQSLEPWHHIARSLCSTPNTPQGLKSRLIPLLAPERADLRPYPSPIGSEENERAGSESLEQVAATMGELVQQLSQRSSVPLVLIVEDLQWAGKDAMQFLKAMREQWQHTGAVLFLTERLGEQSRITPEEIQVLPLKPLSQIGVKTLVASMFGLETAPEQFCDQLHQRSGGNPLFIEEYLKALVDEGHLRREIYGWRLSDEDLRELSTPASVLEILLRRWNRLEDVEQNVLALLAVAGQALPETILARCLPPQFPLPSILLKLQRVGLLSRQGHAGHLSQAAQPAKSHWELLHSRLREVIYQNALGPNERQQRHEKIAWALIAEDRPEDVSAIADHLDAAGQLDQSVPYWIRAGRHAAASYASEDALTALNRALAILSSSAMTDDENEAKRAEALACRAEVHLHLGQYQPAEEDARALTRMAMSRGEEQKLGHASMLLGLSYQYRGQTGEALNALVEARQFYERSGDKNACCRTDAHIGWIYALRGEHERALATLKTALQKLALTPATPVGQVLRMRLGFTLLLKGALTKAQELFRTLQQEFENVVDPLRAARCTAALGQIELRLDQRQQALRLLQEARGTFRRLNAVDDYLTASHNIGVNLIQQGHFSEALLLFEEVHQVSERFNSGEHEIVAAVQLGKLAFRRGQIADALSYLAQAIPKLKENQNRDWVCDCLLTQARCLAILARADEAKVTFGMALPMAREIGSRAFAWGGVLHVLSLLTLTETIPFDQRVGLSQEATSLASECSTPGFSELLHIHHLLLDLELHSQSNDPNLWRPLIELLLSLNGDGQEEAPPFAISVREPLQELMLRSVELALSANLPETAEELLSSYRELADVEHLLHETRATLLETAIAVRLGEPRWAQVLKVSLQTPLQVVRAGLDQGEQLGLLERYLDDW